VRPFSSAVTSDNTSAAATQSQKPMAALVTPNLRPSGSTFGSGVTSGSSNAGVKFEVGGKEMVPERVVAETVRQKSASLVSPRGEKLPMTFLHHSASAGSQESGEIVFVLLTVCACFYLWMTVRMCYMCMRVCAYINTCVCVYMLCVCVYMSVCVCVHTSGFHIT
jgi:hypothetical protein